MTRKLMSALLILIVGLAAAPETRAAGATSLKAVPYRIEVVRGNGFMIFGAFGNEGPTPCTKSNALWIAVSHPQYDQLYSMSLTALTAGLELYGYAHVCKDIGWHSGTWNEITSSGVLHISR